jgi:hypothetical protein
MNRFRRRLTGGLTAGVAVGLIATQLSGCAQDAHASDAPEVAVTAQPQLGGLEEIAEMCGFGCPDEGIAEGNASISGVASVDGFFSSVINFQSKALTVSGSIDAELQAIRADFGIAADANFETALQAQIDANLEAEGGLEINVEPARCAVDAQVTLEAQAKCDASIDPGTATVKCEGSCEVEASAEVECGAEAMVECTFTAPSAMCEGSCKGSCEVELSAMAACSGECKGSCSGECSAYVKNAEGEAECSGTCDGMCMGSCKAEAEASGTCSGKCEGECTVQEPEGGCEGAVRAECKAMGSAMIDCKGKCEGNFEPPMAKAECQASAKADAKINVECTPPRVAINYTLRVGGNVDVEAQARFVAALKNLEVRLPKLKAALAKADLVLDAGEGLLADAGGAVSAGVDAAIEGDASIKAQIGLGCALLELEAVGDALGGASTKLQASFTAATELSAALGG